MSASVAEAAFRRAEEWERLALSEINEHETIAAFAVPPEYLLEAVRSADQAQRARLLHRLRVRADSPSALLADRFTRWLLRRNQFLLLNVSTHRRVHDIYDRGFLRALRLSQPATRRDLSDLLEDHGNALRSLVTTITGGVPRDVVSAEYSPATQLAVLGLTVASVRGPVLDIGSGEHALLVHYLRSAGLEAQGIDRLAGGAMQADWLTFNPGRNRWATITAHHSFTLHFRHHHHRPRAADTAADYAKAFMRYLFALHVGGTFAYSPGIPFFEAILPSDRWLVRPIARTLDGVTTTSTQITRRY